MYIIIIIISVIISIIIISIIISIQHLAWQVSAYVWYHQREYKDVGRHVCTLKSGRFLHVSGITSGNTRMYVDMYALLRVLAE